MGRGKKKGVPKGEKPKKNKEKYNKNKERNAARAAVAATARALRESKKADAQAHEPVKEPSEAVIDGKKEEKESKDEVHNTKAVKSSKKRKIAATAQEPVEEAVANDVEMDVDKNATKAEKSSKKNKHAVARPAVNDVSESAGDFEEKKTSDDESKVTEKPSKKRKHAAVEIEVDMTLPEPHSKREARRLKKGKSIPKSKIASDAQLAAATSDGGETDDGTAPKKEIEKRSPHAIWIGNLAWVVTKDSLKDFIVNGAGILPEAITRIHMPSPDEGKPANKVSTVPAFRKQHNIGYAYVDFSSAQDVVDAVALSEQLLSGRRVLIKDHTSYEGRPLKTKEESRAEFTTLSKRIFIGNLRFDATVEMVQEHFEQCGVVEECFLATFEDTGKCKGYGWVTFAELPSAEAAVRGWVQVNENENDSSSDPPDSDSDISSSSSSSSVASSSSPPPSKRTKITTLPNHSAPIKKHFIDKIQGRPIRREFAEPPQVRYKKRYGKDGTKNQASSNADVAGDADVSTDRNAGREHGKKDNRKDYVPLGNSYAPRLTGAIRAHEGKKVVF